TLVDFRRDFINRRVVTDDRQHRVRVNCRDDRLIFIFGFVNDDVAIRLVSNAVNLRSTHSHFR
ncbi:MAG: hypothetical protein WDA16_09935, partial [Candidatus Thermoplasmatota archaeon]